MAQTGDEAENGVDQTAEDNAGGRSSAFVSRWRPLSEVHTFDSLSYSDFRFLWAGSLSENAAHWLQLLTVGWLMLRLTGGDPVLTGTVVGIRTLPVLLIGPWGGVLADRIDRRKLLGITQFSLAIVAVLFAVLVASTNLNTDPYSGPLQVWHLFAYVLISGTAHSLVQPVREALIPNVVPPELLPNALALSATTRVTARLVAPAVGGVLIEVLGGFDWNFFLEAGAYVFMVLMLFPMKTPYQKESTARRVSPWNNMKEGLGYVWKTRLIRHLILISFFPHFIFQPLVFLLPVFAFSVFGGSEAIGGMLLGAMGGGGLLSAITIASVGFRFGKGRTMLLGLIVGSVSILMMAQLPLLPVAVAAFVVLGFAQNSVRVGFLTLIQTIVPDPLRGRVSSIYQLDNGLTPLAILLIGVLVKLTDAVFVLTLLASIGLAIAVSLLVFARQVRELK